MTVGKFGDIQPNMQPGTGMFQAPSDPISWVTWMEGRLGRRLGNLLRYQEFYDAYETDLAFAQKKFSEAFGPMFYNFRDNFCSLVVDSLSERLTVQGFRFGDDDPEDTGKEPSKGDADGDADDIWKRNFMDAESISVHTDAFVNGEAFLSVWGDKDGNPIILPESAQEVYCQYRPGSRREVVAAIKKYLDDWGTQHVTLWLPDQVHMFDRPNANVKWNAPTSVNNPLGVVPIIPMRNRIRLRRGEPYSEIHNIIPIQQAITKLMADAITASEFAAFPQRVITGIELPEDENGQVASPIQAAIDRMLMFEDENVSFGAFPSADLNNWVSLISLLVQHLSAITRIPPHYFLVGGSNFPSGESLQSAEAGLVRKVSERAIYFGSAWEQAMRLAFAVKGDTARAEAFDCSVIWGDFATRSESLLVDGLVKQAQGLGVPQRILWEKAGYSPDEIERFPALQQAQQDQEIAKQKAMLDAMPDPVMTAPGSKPGLKPSQGNTGNVNKKANTPS
jgi:hypothetical protein